MPAAGRFYRSKLGSDEVVLAGQNNATTYAMSALNTGWAARFQALDTRDIYSVWVYFATVAAAGTITLRIETIDTTNGKPTGTLYDTNATKAFTPVVGWQQVTFASHPTTGLTIGNEYAVLLLTTVGGTTMTLKSHYIVNDYPTIALTAADGTTRTNFAEVSGTVPILSLVYSDGNEDAPWFLAEGAQADTFNCYNTRAAGVKFIVPSGETWNVAGVSFDFIVRTGTPVGDARVRIFNSSDSVITGTTVSVSKNSLLNVGGRRLRFLFPSIVALTAGTYRAAIDQTDRTDNTGTNYFQPKAASLRAATGLASSGFIFTTTTNVDQAPPITWTDTAFDLPAMSLILDDMSASSAGAIFSRIRTGF